MNLMIWTFLPVSSLYLLFRSFSLDRGGGQGVVRLGSPDSRRANTGESVLKPQFHITAPYNWMNDPNGMFVDKAGISHVMFQWNPER